jgi:hypothetical protein
MVPELLGVAGELRTGGGFRNHVGPLRIGCTV